MRAAIYARVSTQDQTTANQLPDLHAYVAARGWTVAREYIDHGISGAKERRPALDDLVKDARRRRFDVLVCWRLDRLGRNLRHLVLLLDDLQAVGVTFVSLGEGIDLGTPAGRLQLHVLAALSEFERARIGERVKAAHSRARAQGIHIGRPGHRLTPADLQRTAHLSLRAASRELGVSHALVHRLRAGCSQTPPVVGVQKGPKTRAPRAAGRPFTNYSVCEHPQGAPKRWPIASGRSSSPSARA